MIVGFSVLGTVVVVMLVVVFGFLSSGDRQVLLSGAQTYDYQGVGRKYRIYKPSQVTSGTKVLFALHGFSDSSWKHAYYTGLHNVAKDYIVVYPEATAPNRPELKAGWNAGFCCGSGWVNKVDDVGFLKSLAEEIVSVNELVDKKIYLTGFSNGAFIAQRLAAEHPEAVEGVAVSSGSIGTEDKQLDPKKPVPILLMHGRNDEIVPMDGGLGKSDPDLMWLPFEATKDNWEKVNGTSATTVTHIYEDGSHQWNDWRILNIWHRQPEASQRSIDFFESLDS